MARAHKSTTTKTAGASTLIRVPSHWLRPGMIVAAPEYVRDFSDDAEPKIAWQDWPKRYADMPDPMPMRLRVDHFDEDEDGESDLVAIDDAGRELGVSFDWNTGAYPDIFLVEAGTIDDLTAAQRRAGAYPNPNPSKTIVIDAPPDLLRGLIREIRAGGGGPTTLEIAYELADVPRGMSPERESLYIAKHLDREHLERQLREIAVQGGGDDPVWRLKGERNPTELVWTEYPPVSSETEAWYQTQPFDTPARGTGVIRMYPASIAVGKRYKPVKFGKQRGYDITYFEIDPSKPERAPGYWHWGSDVQKLAGGPVMLEQGKRIAQLWIDGKHYTVDAGKVSGIIGNPRRGQRGKHVACGSEISDKDCRQLQHVYEAQRARGASKSSAAQQARGSLHHNPTEHLARRLARGHNR